MKNSLLIIFLLGSLTSAAQTSITPDSLNEKLSVHFQNYQAELFRYGGLTTYGEAVSEIGQNQIEKELELFEKVKKNDLINKPTKVVIALLHNILIHSPEKGREFFKLLNKPTENEEIIGSLFSQAIFTGEFGEQLAVENLKSTNSEWGKMWSRYLKKCATYDSSIPTIQEQISKSKDIEVIENLISSLGYISNLMSIDFIKHIIDTTKNDQIQTQAIFTLAELAGYDGIKYLETVKTVGEESKEEKTSSLDWLKKETSSKSLYGTEVSNDIDFIMRFGDIKSPAMTWLEKEGLLDEKKAKTPIVLTKEKKDTLLDLLIESKGFGLEAVKGSLFLSLEPTDINKLLELRRLNFYSPNRFTEGRGKTLGIFIRYLKRR